MCRSTSRVPADYRKITLYLLRRGKQKQTHDRYVLVSNQHPKILPNVSQRRHASPHLTARDGLPQYDNLTHLTIPHSKLCVSDQVVEAFSEAFEKSRFSSLSNLVLGASGLSGKFSQLLKSGCPTLRVLNFQTNLYVKEDEDCWKRLLPQLESVTVGDKSSSFGYYGKSLATLSHVEMDASSTLDFTQAMIACKFPHVTHLDLVQKSLFWGGDHIHKLLSVGSLPSLSHLSMRKTKICTVAFEKKLLQNETVRNLRHFHLSDLQLGSVSPFFRSNKGFPIYRAWPLVDDASDTHRTCAFWPKHVT